MTHSEFIPKAGAALATKTVLDGSGLVRWMVRVQSRDPADNGWQIISDLDTSEYLNDPGNWCVVDYNELCGIEPALIGIWNFPVGSQLQIVRDGRGIQIVETRSGRQIPAEEFYVPPSDRRAGPEVPAGHRPIGLADTGLRGRVARIITDPGVYYDLPLERVEVVIADDEPNIYAELQVYLAEAPERTSAIHHSHLAVADQHLAVADQRPAAEPAAGATLEQRITRAVLDPQRYDRIVDAARGRELYVAMKIGADGSPPLFGTSAAAGMDALLQVYTGRQRPGIRYGGMSLEGIVEVLRKTPELNGVHLINDADDWVVLERDDLGLDDGR